MKDIWENFVTLIKGIEEWLHHLADEYENFVDLSIEGQTHEGRNIYGLHLRKNDEPKPIIFMECGFHAREWVRKIRDITNFSKNIKL